MSYDRSAKNPSRIFWHGQIISMIAFSTHAWTSFSSAMLYIEKYATQMH